MSLKNFVFGLLGVVTVVGVPLHVAAQELPQNPIIIIPGTLASWNWEVMLGSVFSDNWDFLAGVHQYDNLIQAFKDEGLVEDQDFYVAFYDWRLPNSESAEDYLIPKIDEALGDNSEADKVDIVAHSMGGLVARAYLQSDEYRDDVDDFIMLGTPNHGSSDVYTLWEGGAVPRNWEDVQRYGINTYGWYLNLGSLSDSDLYDVVHNQIPSVGELMPTYDFVFNKDDGATTTADAMQEQNDFLQDLNGISTFALLDKVNTLTNIAGTGTSTVGSVPVVDFEPQTIEEEKLWVDGLPEPMPPVRNDASGDNRVLVSSAFLPDPAPVLIQEDEKTESPNRLAALFGAIAHAQFPGPVPFDQEEVETIHGNLPTASIETIFGKLGLGTPSQTYAAYEPPERVMTYWFASPVEVKITDPDGRSITRDSTTVPGAEYDGESDPAGKKMVIIQNAQSGEYTLELTGLGEGGEFHFAVGNFGENNDSVETVDGNIAPQETTAYLIDYQPNATTTQVVISEPFNPNERTPLIMLADLIEDIENYADSGAIHPKKVSRALIGRLQPVEQHLKTASELEEKGENSRFPLWYKAQATLHKRLAVTGLDRFIGQVAIFEGRGFITPDAAADIINKAERLVDAIQGT